ncbi:TPA: hypothetical protein N0F65_007522 [Lagenidium giganteum]|uniref:Protein kinase domain-containing protein n=1 Tax=Lagenidium giganteum TaxID=4803 RepID=A0AAV2ZSI8_9STRA|nr:TPA: hypothetical protein N0F65_007522 [Lagenidium giganteum]
MMSIQDAVLFIADFAPFPGTRTIAMVLLGIADRCADNYAHDNLCMRTHRRLVAFKDRLESLYRNGRLGLQDPALKAFYNIIDEFFRQLQRYAQKNKVMRVLTGNEMHRVVGKVNEEVDGLMRMLQLDHMDRSMSWRQEWEAARQSQNEVQNEVRQLLQQISRDQKAQRETITLMQFELQKRAHEHGSEVLETMRGTFKKVVACSSVSTPKLPEWFQPPDSVIRDDAPFGHGSFGQVYRGRWLGSNVVIKTLVEDSMDNQRAIDQFIEEINLWYRLNHPNVLKMYGACHLDRSPFIICEDAVYGNLEDYLYVNHRANQSKKMDAAPTGCARLGLRAQPTDRPRRPQVQQHSSWKGRRGSLGRLWLEFRAHTLERAEVVKRDWCNQVEGP